ncbi:MAG: hypothetical protein V5783_02265 [Pontiella sp.]
MQKKRKIIVLFLVVYIFAGTPFVFAKDNGVPLVPTHADAAVILARYSGLFERYVNKEATLSECVAFFNKQGIYFGLMEVVNGEAFTRADCARVMGQIELILTGEAKFSGGEVQLPKGIDSWREFCTLDGVDFERGYKMIVQALNNARKLNH